MKRYILLVGEYYYPAGWEDFQGAYNSINDAVIAAYKVEKSIRYSKKSWDNHWFEIIDTKDMKVVRRSEDEPIVEARGRKRDRYSKKLKEQLKVEEINKAWIKKIADESHKALQEIIGDYNG